MDILLFLLLVLIICSLTGVTIMCLLQLKEVIDSKVIELPKLKDAKKNN